MLILSAARRLPTRQGISKLFEPVFQPSKLKIVVENPDDSSFRIEVVTEIETGTYRDKGRDDFVLGTVMQGMRIHSELIY